MMFLLVISLLVNVQMIVASPQPLTISERSDISVYFHYQSQNITFGDWINLFTLCLAPLIAHIVAGVPDPVYLTTDTPSWFRRIGHYNPTSILWRYFAILDRRVRSREWNAAAMAACNTDFWTGTQWDGSEEMMVKSREFCTRLPNSAHIEGLSSSTMKTIIVTLQGVQALYNLLSTRSYGYSINLSTIFQPVAVFGLLRVPGALWMSSDCSFTNLESLYIQVNNNEHAAQDGNTVLTRDFAKDGSPRKNNDKWEEYSDAITELNEITFDGNTEKRKDGPIKGHMKTVAPASLLAEHYPQSSLSIAMRNPTIGVEETTLHSAHSWRGILVRVLYIIPILGLDGICIYYIWHSSKDQYITAVSLSQDIFFLVFLTVTAVVFTWYFLRGESTSTVIPCITNVWYIIYTITLTLMAIVMVVLAAIQTRRTRCGQYTTYAPGIADQTLCASISG